MKDRNKATSDKNLALENSITVLQQNCIDLQQQVSKMQGDLDARRSAHESVADISQELLSAKARNALLETQLSDLTLKLSLGDAELKPFVSPSPDVVTRRNAPVTRCNAL